MVTHRIIGLFRIRPIVRVDRCRSNVDGDVNFCSRFGKFAPRRWIQPSCVSLNPRCTSHGTVSDGNSWPTTGHRIIHPVLLWTRVFSPQHSGSDHRRKFTRKRQRQSHLHQSPGDTINRNAHCNSERFRKRRVGDFADIDSANGDSSGRQSHGDRHIRLFIDF